MGKNSEDRQPTVLIVRGGLSMLAEGQEDALEQLLSGGRREPTAFPSCDRERWSAQERAREVDAPVDDEIGGEESLVEREEWRTHEGGEATGDSLTESDGAARLDQRTPAVVLPEGQSAAAAEALAAEAEDAVDPAEAQSDYTGDQTDKASGAPPICWSSLLWLGRLWCPACGSKDVGWVVPLRLQGALATLRRCRCRDCAHRFRAFWIDVGHAVQILALLCAIALLALLYYQGSGQLAQPPPAPLE